MKKSAMAVIAAWIASGGTAQVLQNPDLYFSTHVDNLVTPVAFEFLNSNVLLVNEKITGKVKVITNGVYTGDALDLTVANQGEMGLLGIAKDINFASNNFVYLFYSRSTSDGGSWQDDRLVRYTWNGSTLTSPSTLWVMGPTTEYPDTNLYHHGGYLRVGPDGKLYLQRGDMLRWDCFEMNNNPNIVGQAGCIYRLNTDGSAPSDNPFFSNPNQTIKKIWVYGFRNGFGMDWDRSTGNLWYSENGPEVYDEINVARPGMNGGWRLIMGPDSRNATYANNNNTPYNANQLFYLPGAQYIDPVFSYLTPIGLAGFGFFSSTRYLESPTVFDNALLGCTNTHEIYLLPIAGNRVSVNGTGALADLVADTQAERELWRMGQEWGGITDARIGPDGYLYVCSWDWGRIQKLLPIFDATAPTSTALVRGNISSGNLTSSVRYPDDARLVITPGVVFSSSQDPVVIESVATSPYGATTTLAFEIESSASSANIRQSIELYDYVDGRYELADQRNLSPSDLRITINTPGPPNNFIQSGTHQIRARVSYRATGAVFQYPWEARIDMIHWKIEAP
jgi:hypothetical protein